MSSIQWFIKSKDQVFGPITSAKLKELATTGRIAPTTPISKSDDGPWSQAGKIQNLFTTPPAVASPQGMIPAKKVDSTTVQGAVISSSKSSRHQDSVIANPQPIQQPKAMSRFCSEGQDEVTIEKLLVRVGEICTRDEEVLFMAVQQKLIANFSPDCVVLTNKRFIIFRQKMLGRMTFLDCLWKDCKDVHMQENIIGATVHFNGTSGHCESIDYLPKPQARMIYRHAQEQEERAQILRRDMRLEELNATADKTVINQAIGTANLPANGQIDVVAKLTQLKQLFDAGIITENDFTSKKSDLLKQM